MGNPIANLGHYAHPKGGGKKSYGEGSKADIAQDNRGMKATGMTSKQYEASARDKKEDTKRMKGGKK